MRTLVLAMAAASFLFSVSARAQQLNTPCDLMKTEEDGRVAITKLLDFPADTAMSVMYPKLMEYFGLPGDATKDIFRIRMAEVGKRSAVETYHLHKKVTKALGLPADTSHGEIDKYIKDSKLAEACGYPLLDI